MRRHLETARVCLVAVGCALPVDVDARWNEFDHEELLLKHEPAFSVKARLLREARDRGGSDGGFRDVVPRRRRALGRGGAFDHEYTESWLGFRARCEAGLDALVASLGPSRTALVFTSGGPYLLPRAATTRALGHPRALPALPIAGFTNCGVTKMIYGAHGTRLSTLNEHAWFEGAERRLLTYR